MMAGRCRGPAKLVSRYDVDGQDDLGHDDKDGGEGMRDTELAGLPASLFVLTALILAALTVTARAQDATGPSFDCSHVTSTVNKLICTTPELSALDRELANVFQNTAGQAAFDAKALRREEDAWLAAMHKSCNDVACIRTAYQNRLAALRDRSLRAASPAAYAETRPFPAPPALLAEAQALIGKSCGFEFMKPDPALPGFMPSKGMVPVIGQDLLVVPRNKGGSRFAFLFATPSDDQSCTVRDVVVLPAPEPGDRFLNCALDAWDPGHGFGYRRAKTKAVAGYWVVKPERMKFERVALAVLGSEDAVRCTEPEWGE
jgi:uncharacterized protein YecT (DUF1311 family)